MGMLLGALRARQPRLGIRPTAHRWLEYLAWPTLAILFLLLPLGAHGFGEMMLVEAVAAAGAAALCLGVIAMVARLGRPAAPDDPEAHRATPGRVRQAALCLGLAFVALALLSRVPSVNALDGWLVRQLHPWGGPRVDQWMLGMSNAGGRALMMLALSTLALALCLIRRARLAPLVLLSVLGSAALEVLAKALVLRPRPEVIAALAPDSFPSGHVLTGTTLVGSLLVAAFAHPVRPAWRLALVLAGCGWIGLLGTARVCLGRHYTMDVLGGAVLGAAWLLLCWSAQLAVAPTRAASVGCPARSAVMRRRLALGGLSFLAAVVVVAGPWPVDRSAYDGQPYHRRSLASLHAATAAMAHPPATGELLAGYGESEITPAVGQPLAGYGRRRQGGCRGAHDTLRAQALALSDGSQAVVILSGDLLLITDGLADAITRDLSSVGLDRARIYYAATHTHSGPGGYGTTLLEGFWLGGSRQQYFNRLRAAFSDSAREAIAALRPVDWTFGSVTLPRAVRNRVRRGEPVDPELSLLAIRQNGTGQQFRLVVFGAHATVEDRSDPMASGDYPGALTAALEGRRGVRAMFCAGAVGSCSCAGFGGRRSHRSARRYGASLAAHVERLLEGASYSRRAALGSFWAPVELGVPQPRIGPSLRAAPLLARQLLPQREACIQGLRLNDVLFLGAPADLSGELSNRVKAHARQRGFRPVVTSFAGRYVGYLLPERYYDGEDDQESRLMSMHGPNNGEYITALLQASIDGLAAAGRAGP